MPLEAGLTARRERLESPTKNFTIDQGLAHARTVGGKYRLGRSLGEGGMGYVHEAEHVTLGERVALKFLKPEFAKSPEFAERFLREARSLFRIESENVVRILDVDADDDGAPYLVMEFLEGETLDRVLRRRGELEVTHAVEIITQLCMGLSEAHALGIVHRDIKAANVIVTAKRDGQVCVKVLDFGIAQIGNAPDSMVSRLTGTHAVIGTPSYMAPEQLRAARAADARSDVWSVGVLFHELLTGRLPWSASSPYDLVFLQHTETLTTSAFGSHLPNEIGAIVLQCLELDADARLANASIIVDALRPWRSSTPLLAKTILGSPPSRTGSTEVLTGISSPGIRASGIHAPRMPSSSVTPPPVAAAGVTPSGAHRPPPTNSPSIEDRSTRRLTIAAVGAIAVLLSLLFVLLLRFATKPSPEDDGASRAGSASTPTARGAPPPIASIRPSIEGAPVSPTASTASTPTSEADAGSRAPASAVVRARPAVAGPLDSSLDLSRSRALAGPPTSGVGHPVTSPPSTASASTSIYTDKW